MNETSVEPKTSPPERIRIFDGAEAAKIGIRICRARAGQQRRLMQQSDREGNLVRDGRIEPWRWNGTIEAEGMLYATFSALEGGGPTENLEELIEKSPAEVFRCLAGLLRAYDTLKSHRPETAAGVFPAGVFFDTENTWYFLPPGLAAIVREELPVDPDLPSGTVSFGEKGLAAAISLILYRVLTGHRPYEADPDAPAHPQLYEPKLRDDAARMLLDAFSLAAIPSFEEIGNILGICLRQSWKNELDETQAEEIRTRRRRELHKEGKRRRLDAKLRRKGPPVLIALAAAAVIIFFLSPLSGRKGSGVSLTGLSPEEVVETFYEGISSLDHEMIDTCTIGDAGKSYLNEVMTLFVISKVREGVEQTKGNISPRQWESENRPPLKNYVFVYGIDGLVILDTRRIISDSASERVRVEVRYLRYTTLSKEESQNSSTGTVEIYEVKERLILEETKDETWKIREIQTRKNDLRERVFAS
jgi:hypothetical protein